MAANASLEKKPLKNDERSGNNTIAIGLFLLVIRVVVVRVVVSPSSSESNRFASAVAHWLVLVIVGVVVVVGVIRVVISLGSGEGDGFAGTVAQLFC